jgi:hypothetical protein
MARTIRFVHGRNYSNGGWFDTTSGKPKILVLHSGESDYAFLGDLTDYPETTAESFNDLDDMEEFLFPLPEPAMIIGVKVQGVPAHGDDSKQSFASVAELGIL